MARSRNIKPGFFTNEVLGELPALARLLFAGLWTIADREGRLEDRPKKIKAELLPYDQCDADELLQQLHDAGFVQRYAVNGGKFIQVVKWAEHQNPHIKEAASTIQAPDKNCADSVQGQDEQLPDPERAGLIPSSLIPDSGFLIPQESLLTQAPARPAADLALVRPKEVECPHLEVLTLWAEVLPELPQHLPSQWRGKRADHLRARWRETSKAEGWKDKSEGLDYFRKLFAYVGRSRFLTGKVHQRDPTQRTFVIELEWLVSPNNWAKVLEGKYHQEAA